MGGSTSNNVRFIPLKNCFKTKQQVVRHFSRLGKCWKMFLSLEKLSFIHIHVAVNAGLELPFSL